MCVVRTECPGVVSGTMNLCGAVWCCVVQCGFGGAVKPHSTGQHAMVTLLIAHHPGLLWQLGEHRNDLFLSNRVHSRATAPC